MHGKSLDALGLSSCCRCCERRCGEVEKRGFWGEVWGSKLGRVRQSQFLWKRCRVINTDTAHASPFQSGLT